MKITPTFCHICGIKLPAETRFCPSCGKRIEPFESGLRPPNDIPQSAQLLPRNAEKAMERPLQRPQNIAYNAPSRPNARSDHRLPTPPIRNGPPVRQNPLPPANQGQAFVPPSYQLPGPQNTMPPAPTVRQSQGPRPRLMGNGAGASSPSPPTTPSATALSNMPNVTPVPQPIPTSTPDQKEERILLVIPGFMRVKKLNSTQFTLIGTDRRFIFAQITNQMIKNETLQAKDKARDQGKGYIGQKAAQWGSALAYQDILARISNRFWGLQPEMILRGVKENFALPTHSMIAVETERKDRQKRIEYEDADPQIQHNFYTEVRFITNSEKIVMEAPDNPNIRKNLSQIYGAMVR